LQIRHCDPIICMGSVILLWRVIDQPEKESLVKENDSDHVILTDL
jgi:hypothetical protein